MSCYRLGSCLLAAWAAAACSAAPRHTATPPAGSHSVAPATPVPEKPALPPACDVPDSLPCAEWTCEKGDAEACLRAAAQHADDSSSPANPARALHYYERACHANGAEGCYQAGLVYDYGHGVAKNAAKAARLFEQSCELDHIRGCNAAGYLFENDGRGVEDPARAARAFERSCQHEDSSGCVNLAELHNDGRGVVVDQVRSTELYLRACKLATNGPGGLGMVVSCQPAAERLLSGIGIAADTLGARELYEHACPHGAFHSCDMARHLSTVPAGQKPPPCPTRKLMGDHEPLTHRAHLYARGFTVPQDPTKAKQLLEAGCSAGEGSGCAELGDRVAEGTKAQTYYRKARTALEQQCRCENDFACHELARLHLQGLGGPKNQREGERLLEIACAGARASEGTYGGYSFPECPPAPDPNAPPP